MLINLQLMEGVPFAAGLMVSQKDDGQRLTTAWSMIGLMLWVCELSVGGLRYPLEAE